jgi:hypothetical protein
VQRGQIASYTLASQNILVLLRRCARLRLKNQPTSVQQEESAKTINQPIAFNVSWLSRGVTTKQPTYISALAPPSLFDFSVT